MSRLTIDEVINHCRKTCESIEIVAIAQGKNQDDITSKQYWEHYLVGEWLNELRKYTDAEEQGLLLKLPCPIGTTVYAIYDNKVTKGALIRQSSICFLDDFGKKVFLTKEEAEQKLKEMESDTNGN